MRDLRGRLLPVLDNAVERGALTRDEAFAVLDMLDQTGRLVALAEEWEKPNSHCGAYAAPGSEFREFYEEQIAKFGDWNQHLPDAYSPYCDGCAAAQAANREGERNAAELRAALKGDS